LVGAVTFSTFFAAVPRPMMPKTHQETAPSANYSTAHSSIVHTY
jgi:hypothetical protein